MPIAINILQIMQWTLLANGFLQLNFHILSCSLKCFIFTFQWDPSFLYWFLSVVLLKIGSQNKRHQDTETEFHWLRNLALDLGQGLIYFCVISAFAYKFVHCLEKRWVSYLWHRFPLYLMLLILRTYRLFPYGSLVFKKQVNPTFQNCSKHLKRWRIYNEKMW